MKVWDEPWDDMGMVRIPRDDSMEVTMVWRRDADKSFRLACTRPPLPNMEEMLWNVRGLVTNKHKTTERTLKCCCLTPVIIIPLLSSFCRRSRYAFPHTLTPGFDDSVVDPACQPSQLQC